MFDSKSAPIHLSIEMLKALHAKWVYLLNGLEIEDLKKEFIHPDGNELVSIQTNIGMYDRNYNHHFAPIYNLMKAKQWL